MSLRPPSQSQILQLKKQVILSQKKQSQLQTYIMELEQKLSKQTKIHNDLQRLKQNQSEIRDVLRLKVSEIEDQKEELMNQLRLTQQLLKQSQRQIEQLKEMHEIQMIKYKALDSSKKLENSRTSNSANNRTMLDQNYRIAELNKQIEIMKQLHSQDVKKIQNEYEITIQKIQAEKIHLEKIMRLSENERAIISPPSFRQRKPEDAYNKQLQKLFNIKCEEYEQQLNKKDQELMEMEEEMKAARNRQLQCEQKYLQMTAIIRRTMQDLETLKGQKDILEKTLDFSKKIAEQQRIQFHKIIEIERQNHQIQIDQLKDELREDAKRWSITRDKSDETKKVCNFILTKLKVIHAFTSDLKKYFQNQQIQMKQMIEFSLQKILYSFQNSKNKRDSKNSLSQYEILIEKYKTVLREKDKQIIELRKSKFKYSQNIQYLNKILVDD